MTKRKSNLDIWLVAIMALLLHSAAFYYLLTHAHKSARCCEGCGSAESGK